MALIKCKECGREISDGSNYCKYCGNGIDIIPTRCRKCGMALEENSSYCKYCGIKVNVKNKNQQMRKAFSITDIVLGIMFFSMIISSEGGIDNNMQMSTISFWLILTGFYGIIGVKNKPLTIISILCYAIGIIANLLFIPAAAGHIFIAAMLITFLTLVCIGLSDKKSFKK